jgi:hypothetical protein
MKKFDLETALPAEALDYLRSVYRNPLECTHVRLKAAAVAIEYERPRLAVIASIGGDDFAEQLGRCIERSAKVKVIEAAPVCGSPSPAPMVPDRRYRRA